MDVTNGMVSESLQQFSTETGILLPADLDGARQALISGEHWPHWLAWRNNRLGELFAELEQNLQAVAPGRKFCLAMTDSFRCGELAETTSPRLHGVVDPQQVAGLAGWNEAVWQSPRMMLMQPHRNAPQEDALWQKSERGADPHRAAIFSNAGYATALFVHRSAPVQFNASSQQPLLGESDLRVTRLQPLSPPGSLARKRFAEALHSSDLRCLADGGWLPTAGQEEFTARMFAAFRQLPDRDFADLPALDAATDPGAVRVRQAATGEDWMAYLVNASPWPVSVEIPIRSSGLCLPRVWGNGSVQWQEDRQTAGSGSLQVQLEAWGLVVCRIDQPALQASGFRSQLPQDAGQLLQEQVFRLQSLLSQPAVPQAREWLRNPSFDGPDEKPEGWRWSVAQGTLVRSLADPSDPSNRCLELQGGNQPVWIRSSQFRVPDTGRLSFSIRLRADRPWEEISLRLSVESSANRRPWYRYGTVSQASGGSNTPSGVPRSSAEWNEYVVHFDDLPADPDALLRVGLDLMGPGTVLADDVRLFDDRWSERDIRAITQIVATAGNLLSDPNQADQSRRLLESYWPLCFEELATRRPAIESSRMTPPVLQASSAPLPESSAAGSQPASVRESGETSLEAATQRTPWRLRRPRRGNEPLLPIHRSP